MKIQEFVSKAQNVRKALIEDQLEFEDKLTDIIPLSECELTREGYLTVKIDLTKMKIEGYEYSDIRRHLDNTLWIVKVDRGGSDLKPLITFCLPLPKKEDFFNPNDRIGDGL